MDRLYLKDPGGLLTPAACARARAALPARGGRPPDRAAQPLHDRARAVRLHARGSGPGFQVLHTAVEPLARGHVEPGRRDDAAQPRGRGLLAPARPRRARRRCRSTSASSAREKGLPVGRAAGVRRDLLPPSARRRHGLDDAADARGAAPARSCSTPCSRRSAACARRWATRSSSRRSRSSSRRRRCGT